MAWVCLSEPPNLSRPQIGQEAATVPRQLEESSVYLLSCPHFLSPSCGGPLEKPSLSPGAGAGGALPVSPDTGLGPASAQAGHYVQGCPGHLERDPVGRRSPCSPTGPRVGYTCHDPLHTLLPGATYLSGTLALAAPTTGGIWTKTPQSRETGPGQASEPRSQLEPLTHQLARES